MSLGKHPHRNLAASMGRWSAAHWKKATFGWLAFVVVAFGLGGLVGTKQIDQNSAGPGESGRANRILDAGFKQPAGENVLIQSPSHRVGDPAFRVAINDVVRRVSKQADVRNVRSPLAPGNADQIAKSGHAVLVAFDIRGDKNKAVDKIAPVLASVGEAQRVHPGFVIGEFGDASAEKGVATAYSHDLEKAGTLSLPITLIILVVAFGALVAAGIPLLLALTGVFATVGLIALPSHLLPVAREAYAMVLLIGLAVGVDYSMFYLKRARQERAAGRSKEAALAAAAATSGRSVLVSGLTVMAAMAGMFLTGDQTFTSLALATILVVAVAVLGSLTVLPALLSRLGDNVDRLRVPLIGRLRRDDGEGRIWGAIVDLVLRRPALSAAVAAGLLLALAAPALQLHIQPQSPASFPKSLEVIKTYNRMQQAFPGAALPANVVVKTTNVHAPATQAAIAELERRTLASGRAAGPVTVDVSRDGTVANITVPIAGTGTDAASSASLRALRNTIVPQTVGALPDTEVAVTGQTAQWMDQADELRSNLPPVVTFVLLLAFALMLVSFRSLVVAAKAIVLNLLSVAAAYGVLVLVFQHGVGKGLIGLDATTGIDPVVPLLLFVILFGLSMDYHVFILSRIREAVRQGAGTDEAVAQGIRSTAGVVTSAAIVMVCVFAVFATLSLVFFKQFGVGLAAAILIDATIVRAVLLPATMKLLGDWNWYLPRWLEWLPRIELDAPALEPVVAAEARPVPAPAPRGRRRLGVSRIVSLVLLGAVALGLAYLRFSPDHKVTVPTGAKAGDLVLHSCSYGTEKGSYKADCGTLVVPENRADPRARLIALPVVRIRARSAHPGTPVFRLQGGPGITNMQFADASRFAGERDVVLVGYRGVDGSSRLDCPEVASARSHARDFLTDESYRADAAAFRACAARLQASGVDLAGYTLPERVDDLDAARRALGYPRIDLLSESAGTRTALIYAWRYPKRINRSVLIGVNPPGGFLWDAKTTGEQIGRYAALCGQDAGCRSRTPDLAASLHAAISRIPDHWWFLPIKPGNVQAAAFFGLIDATDGGAGPLAGTKTIDTLLAAGKGEGGGAWLLSTMAQLLFPKGQVWGDVAAVGRADAAAARRYFAAHADRGSVIGSPGTDLIWAGGRLLDAWPANPDENEYTRVRDSRVDTLLIGGTLDFATPPQNATRQLLPHLPNGRQVVIPNIGHAEDFWSYEPAASTRLVNTYLASGRVDTSLYTPARADFTPSVSQTRIAQIVLAVMLSLAGLTVLSLLWMLVRVRRRGGYGRKSSVFLRAVYPVVLGFGGWFAGVLIALTAFPTVPLDDVLLAAVSVGVPVGLGIYLGWVGDRSAAARLTGLAAALGGALAGGWLGYHAVDGLFALLTTIAGAAVGGNLALLGLDVARDWQASVRFAEARPVARPA
jgi:RND superfamily putative drug exporter